MVTRDPAPPEHDRPEPAEFRRPEQKLARPCDAATLILYRRAGTEIEVLMGARHPRHRFMPNRYVFPGGRIDRADAAARAAAELLPHIATQVGRGCPTTRGDPAKRARMLAMAAIRETFEETGLILGRADPCPGASTPPAWREFFATGMAPALDVLDYLARAVTPPYRPVRFNARFFMADASHVHGRLQGSGELEDLRWLPVGEIARLPTAQITAIVLNHLAEALCAPLSPDPARPVPLYHMRHGKHCRDRE